MNINPANVLKKILEQVMALRLPHDLISTSRSKDVVALFGNAILASALLLFARSFVSGGVISGQEYVRVWAIVAVLIGMSSLFSIVRNFATPNVLSVMKDAKKLWLLFLVSFYIVIFFSGLILLASYFLNADVIAFYDDLMPVSSSFGAYFFFSLTISLCVMLFVMMRTMKLMTEFWNKISSWKYACYVLYSLFIAFVAAVALSS